MSLFPEDLTVALLGDSAKEHSRMSEASRGEVQCSGENENVQPNAMLWVECFSACCHICVRVRREQAEAVAAKIKSVKECPQPLLAKAEALWAHAAVCT